MTKEQVTDAVFDTVERITGHEVSLFDTFGELGVDSLDAVEIAMALERKFGKPLYHLADNIKRDTQVYGLTDIICKHLGI